MRLPRPRLSIRLTMSLILVLAVSMGWIINSANKKRNAIATIKRLHGHITFADMTRQGKGKKWIPKWVTKSLGDDYFREAVGVHMIRGDSMGDADLRRICSVGPLRSLILDGARISPTGWSQLKRLTQLENLSLRETTIDDRSAEFLSGLHNLTHLRLNRTPIGDEGLKHLRGLDRLAVLELSRTRVSDAGLVSLAKLRRLDTLGLAQTSITDAGLTHLETVTSLTVLDLSKTGVSQAGIKKLRQAIHRLSIAH